jgi:hypothetical protein
MSLTLFSKSTKHEQEDGLSSVNHTEERMDLSTHF